MSSGSSISSLFKNNSFSTRSTSLFQKSFSSFESSKQRPRSQSIQSNINPRLIAITKISNILAPKIRMHNYFLFCKMEGKKNKRIEIPSKVEKVEINTEGINEKEQQNENPDDKFQSEIEKKQKGLHILCDFISLHETKRDETTKIKNSFKQIFNTVQKKKKVEKLYHNLVKIYSVNLSTSLMNISNQSKYIEKVDVFFNYVETIFTPKLRKVFNKIREYSFNMKILTNSLEKEKEQNLQNLSSQKKSIKDEPLTEHFSHSKLKAITEEESSAFSDDECIKYVTPEKENTKEENFDFELEEKTLKKESIQLAKKETIKEDHFCHQEEEVSPNKTLLISKDNADQYFSKKNVKVQSKRFQFTFGKATKIQTKLEDSQNMNFQIPNSNEIFMFKQNHIYSDNLHQLIPDLRNFILNLDDNMGVFESMWKQNESLNTEFGSGLSERTIDKNDYQLFNIKENQKTVGVCIDRFTEENFIFNEKSHTENDSSSRSNHKDDQQTVTSTSRVTKYIKNVPFVTEAINLNEDSTGSFGKYEENDNFYSSPTDKNKFIKMAMDLGKCLNKQKLNQSYMNSSQTHKVSVNLPRKSSFCPIKSQYGSANKINGIGSYKTGFLEERSVKKSNQNDSFKKFSYKENNDWKENIEERLEKEKEKFGFYTTSKSKNKEEPKRNSNFSSINQSQLTARKIQKEIENIMKNKNRNSIGNLKIGRNK